MEFTDTNVEIKTDGISILVKDVDDIESLDKQYQISKKNDEYFSTKDSLIFNILLLFGFLLVIIKILKSLFVSIKKTSS